MDHAIDLALVAQGQDSPPRQEETPRAAASQGVATGTAAFRHSAPVPGVGRSATDEGVYSEPPPLFKKSYGTDVIDTVEAMRTSSADAAAEDNRRDGNTEQRRSSKGIKKERKKSRKAPAATAAAADADTPGSRQGLKGVKKERKKSRKARKSKAEHESTEFDGKANLPDGLSSPIASPPPFAEYYIENGPQVAGQRHTAEAAGAEDDGNCAIDDDVGDPDAEARRARPAWRRAIRKVSKMPGKVRKRMSVKGRPGAKSAPSAAADEENGFDVLTDDGEDVVDYDAQPPTHHNMDLYVAPMIPAASPSNSSNYDGFAGLSDAASPPEEAWHMAPTRTVSKESAASSASVDVDAALERQVMSMADRFFIDESDDEASC